MNWREARQQLRTAEQDLLVAESLMDLLIDSDPEVEALQRERQALEALIRPSPPMTPLELLRHQFADPHTARPVEVPPTHEEITQRVGAVLRNIRRRTTHLRESPSPARHRLLEAEARCDQARAALTEGPREEERLLGIIDRAEDRDRIRRAAERRSIARLWHFTRRGNLPSILVHGLATRAEIDTGGISHATVTDSQRLDNLRESVSLSISHPNYRMFYSYRQAYGPAGNWCVVGLDPSVLWQLKCLYCTVNASTSGMVRRAKDWGQNEQSFQSMFRDPVGTSVSSSTPRAELGLNDAHPSDPQAEVLVLERISAKYVQEIAVIDQRTRVAVEDDLRRSGLFEQCRLLSVDERLFDRRHDWQYW